MNSRVTKKEKGLIKGALRRVFSRSELRRTAIDLSRIEHSDSKHPRVTKWSRCASCLLPTPSYKAQADHIFPVVPLDRTADEMTANELVDRMWCEAVGLQILCLSCHKLKTLLECKERHKLKKERKNGSK